MRIIFIGQKGIPAQTGGVERYVENLAVNLVEQGQEVFVYSRKNYNNLTQYKGVKIISLPSLSGKNFEAISHTFLACLDLVRRPVDVIHFQSIGPASLMWLVRILKPRTPIVFTFHCRDYHHQKWGRLARWYLYFGERVGCLLADRVITISKELEKYSFDNYRKLATYIPNGATVQNRLPAHKIYSWGLKEGNYFVSVSRLIRHKGIHHIIDAYKKLSTDKKLVIVGDGAHTDDYVRELYKLASDDKRIIFTGNQTGDSLTELYSNAFAFIQASESEGLSIALLEAMSYGLACLASDIEANTEALGGTGYLFKTNDIIDLKLKMQELLVSQNLSESGAKALERVRSDYSWQDIAKKVLAVYSSFK